MNQFIEMLTGMDKMSDQVIATELLITVKSGIRNYAMAITEVASPEVKAILRKQLQDAILMHEKVTNYMVSREYYHPFNPEEQVKVDVKASDAALKLTM